MLSTVGFSSSGVVAGTAAAAMQSSVRDSTKCTFERILHNRLSQIPALWRALDWQRCCWFRVRRGTERGSGGRDIRAAVGTGYAGWKTFQYFTAKGDGEEAT